MIAVNLKNIESSSRNTIQGVTIMKTKQLLMAVAVLTAVLAFGGESFARGGGGGGGGGRGQGTQTRSQSATGSATQVRPEGSQRRDGTFQTTGTTANGSTTRPTNGRGVMDGTGINRTIPTTTTTP